MNDDVRKLVAAADAVQAAQMRQQARRASEDVAKWPKWMQETARGPLCNNLDCFNHEPHRPGIGECQL